MSQRTQKLTLLGLGQKNFVLQQIFAHRALQHSPQAHTDERELRHPDVGDASAQTDYKVGAGGFGRQEKRYESV